MPFENMLRNARHETTAGNPKRYQARFEHVSTARFLPRCIIRALFVAIVGCRWMARCYRAAVSAAR
eukprot:5005758-Lingulodinium_polyedra.AAC.1